MDIEKLTEQLIDHENRISELESLLKTKGTITRTDVSKPLPAEVLRLILAQLNKLKLSQLTIIILKFHEELSRKEIINILKKWRKKGVDSLRGGNFNRDLIRTGFIIEVGKIGNETVYELTKDGKVEADKIIKGLQDKKEEK